MEGLQYKVGLDFSDFQKGVKVVAGGFEKLRSSGETTFKSFEQLQAQQSRLKKALSEAPSAESYARLGRAIAQIDGMLNKTGRAAGNAAPALFSLSQVARDLPFGFIAIQNNIPLVIDAFTNLSKESGGTLKAFKALGSAMLGPAGIGFATSVITSSLTSLVQEYGSLSGALKSIFGLSNGVAQAQEQMAKGFRSAAADSETEAKTVRNLVGILNNHNLTNDQRTATYQRLKSEYPGLIQNMTEENALTKQGGDLIRKRSEELIKYIKLKGQEKVLTALIEKQLEKQLEGLEKIKQLDSWEAVKSGFMSMLQGGGILGSPFRAITKDVTNAAASMEFFDKQLLQVQQDIAKIDPKITGLETFKEKKPIEVPFVLKPKAQLSGDPDKDINTMFKVQNGIEVPLKIVPDLSSANKTFENTIFLIKQKWEQLSEDLQRSIEQALQTAVTDSLVNIGETIGDIFSGKGFTGIKQIFNIIGNALQTVGRYAIQTGVAMEAFKKSMKTLFATPAAAIGAGVALVGLGTILKNKFNSGGVGLAQGGIVPPGFDNDTFPARLSSREAVIPLDKLEGLICNAIGGGGGELTARVSGNDLVFILAQANKNQNRRF